MTGSLLRLAAEAVRTAELRSAGARFREASEERLSRRSEADRSLAGVRANRQLGGSGEGVIVPP